MLNLKITSFDFKNFLIEDDYKYDIKHQPKKLINYDLLAKFYEKRKNVDAARVVIDEVKWAAFQEMTCFDRGLLFGMDYNPFDWKTKFSLREKFSEKIEQLENFYDSFPGLTIREANKSFFNAIKFFPIIVRHHLIEILLTESNWSNINNAADLQPGTKKYISEIWYFLKNKEKLLNHTELMIGLTNILMGWLYNQPDHHDREKLILVSFITALMVCLHRRNGFDVFEFRLGMDNLHKIQLFWKIEEEDFLIFMEDLWLFRQNH